MDSNGRLLNTTISAVVISAVDQAMVDEVVVDEVAVAVGVAITTTVEASRAAGEASKVTTMPTPAATGLDTIKIRRTLRTLCSPHTTRIRIQGIRPLHLVPSKAISRDLPPSALLSMQAFRMYQIGSEHSLHRQYSKRNRL